MPYWSNQEMKRSVISCYVASFPTFSITVSWLNELFTAVSKKNFFADCFPFFSFIFHRCATLAAVGRTRFPWDSWVKGKAAFWSVGAWRCSNHLVMYMSLFHCKGPGWHPWYPWNSRQEGLQGRPRWQWELIMCPFVSQTAHNTRLSRHLWSLFFITSLLCVCDWADL